MSKMRKLHTRRKRRTSKQGKGRSLHRSKSGRTGSVHSKKLATRRPKE